PPLETAWPTPPPGGRIGGTVSSGGFVAHRGLMAVGKELVHGLLQLLYPACCCVCRRLLGAADSPFCAPCRAALTADPHPTCPRCAGSVGPFVNLNGGCVRCRDTSFQFTHVLRLGPYDGLLRDV